MAVGVARAGVCLLTMEGTAMGPATVGEMRKDTRGQGPQRLIIVIVKT
jgi:hypothetical protein